MRLIIFMLGVLIAFPFCVLIQGSVIKALGTTSGFVLGALGWIIVERMMND